jgi:hypothetical protein
MVNGHTPVREAPLRGSARSAERELIEPVKPSQAGGNVVWREAVEPGETDYAWAAGFFDGEGYAGITACFNKKRGKHYTRPVTSIAQNHREVLDRFCWIVGVGRVRGPYLNKSNGHQRKPYWQWQTDSMVTIRQVYGRLWPYLGSVKRSAFEIALSHQGPGRRNDPVTGRFLSADV